MTPYYDYMDCCIFDFTFLFFLYYAKKENSYEIGHRRDTKHTKNK